MITWPIFVGLLLAVVLLFVSIRLEDSKEKNTQQEEEERKLKAIDLENRKKRIQQEKEAND